MAPAFFKTGENLFAHFGEGGSFSKHQDLKRAAKQHEFPRQN